MGEKKNDVSFRFCRTPPEKYVGVYIIHLCVILAHHFVSKCASRPTEWFIIAIDHEGPLFSVTMGASECRWGGITQYSPFVSPLLVTVILLIRAHSANDAIVRHGRGYIKLKLYKRPSIRYES